MTQKSGKATAKVVTTSVCKRRNHAHALEATIHTDKKMKIRQIRSEVFNLG